MGHSIPQVLQRRSEEAGTLNGSVPARFNRIRDAEVAKGAPRLFLRGTAPWRVRVLFSEECFMSGSSQGDVLTITGAEARSTLPWA